VTALPQRDNITQKRPALRKNFAITGVAGFVAPRHLKAIKDTGHTLVAATDPHDAVGVLDGFSFDVRFFPEIERFDRHLEKLRRGPEDDRVHYVSICSPNYLHDAHIRMALRTGADAICEKPIVINPWNLDALVDLERERGHRVFTILQLRLHPDLVALRDRVMATGGSHQIELTYVTARGPWYFVSWKGREDRSGGLVTNIGIHFFDLLIWLFGSVRSCEVHVREPNRCAGALVLDRARVVWFLSADYRDLPFAARPGERTTFRSISVDGHDVEFSEGFSNLHTRSYEEVLAQRGFGIEDARPSIELVHRLRTQPLVTPSESSHPMLLPESSR
jgi:UDP-N-acetyl-2-amino-2-deoxyglucuronate dehydrogenase